MSKHKNLPKVAVILATLLFVIIFSGCAVLDKLLGKELQPESFLPMDTLMTFTFDTSDPEQTNFLDSILDKFPKTDDGNLLDRLRERIMEDVLKGKYSYETDIKPIFGKGTKIVVGFPSLKTGDVPHPYILAKINSQEAFDNFLQKIVQVEKGEIKQVQGHDVFFSKGTSGEPDNGCLGSYNGILLLVDSCSSYEGAVALAKSGKETLAANKDYKKVVDNLGGQYLAGVYLNIKDAFDFLKSQGPYDIPLWMDNEVVSSGVAGGFSVLAMNDGLDLKGYMFADKSKLGDESLDIYQSGDTSLIEKIPGESIIFYSSSFDLAGTVQRQMDLFSQKTGQDFSQNLSAMLQDTVGIDLEEDLYSWMRQGFSFSVHNNEGSIVPGITIAVDASEAPDTAKEVVTKLDAQISGLLTLAGMEDEKFSEAISKDEVSGLHRISVDFAKVQEVKAATEEEAPEVEGPAAAEEELVEDLEVPLEEAETAPPLFFGYPTKMFLGEKLEIWYGVTDSNQFIVSTMLNFPEKYGGGLKASEEFTKASSKVEDYDAVSFYIETAGLLRYLDNLVNYLESSGEIAEGGEQAYEEFKKYIFPFKSVIVSSSASKYEVEVGGFIGME